MSPDFTHNTQLNILYKSTQFSLSNTFIQDKTESNNHVLNISEPLSRGSNTISVPYIMKEKKLINFNFTTSQFGESVKNKM